MSGSARAGTISREAYLRAVNPEALQCALSRARPGYLCFSVDKDLHGCRQTGSNPFWELLPVCRFLSINADTRSKGSHNPASSAGFQRHMR